MNIRKPTPVRIRSEMVGASIPVVNDATFFCPKDSPLRGAKLTRRVYLACDAEETISFFILSEKAQPLGKVSLVLEKQDIKDLFNIHTLEQVHLIMEKDILLRKLWRDEYSNLQGQLSNKTNSEIRHIFDVHYPDIPYTDAAKMLALQTVLNSRQIFEVVPPLSKEDVLALGAEDMVKAIDIAIHAGFTIDSRLSFMAKAAIVKLSIEPGFEKMAKYRGHALFIKNTKAGLTTLAERLGKNFSAATYASLEGWADADKNQLNSVLHEQTGFVNFDEFLQMKDNMVLKIYNFLEQGTYTAGKAAQEIANKSCAMCCFTANPQELEGKPDTAFGEYSSQMLLTTFRVAISKLTTTQKAMGSRFGYIVFAPDMAQAVRTSELTDVEVEDAQSIVDSIFIYASPQITTIYKEARAWLEQPMPEYAAQVHTLAQKLPDAQVEAFWCGQEASHRHMHGMALSTACVDNIHGILHGTTQLTEILEEARDALQSVQDTNLESLSTVLALEQEKKGITKADVENIRPAYLRPLLHTTALLEDGESYPLSLLLDAYPKLVPMEARKKYGRFDMAAHIKQRFNLAAANRSLSRYAGLKFAWNDKGEILSCDEKNKKLLRSFYDN